MDKYKKYKEVRMGWLERIPAHWATVPLKYSIGKSPFSFVDGDWIESKVIESDGIRYLTTGNVGVINYKEQGNGFISEKTFRELNCTEVFPGDVLISRLNFPIGRACIVPDLGYRIVVAVDNVIFRPDETKYNKKFLVYQMNCYPYSENANFIARGSTMQRITRTQLGALKLCIPPLEEQNAMVTYLDKKCSEIDKVISAQQKRIALLQELKQSVITHAVTKGLNPNVEMKESGVEWIGEVPITWEVMKTSLAFKGIGSGTTPSTSKKEYYDEDGKYWLQTGDLNDGIILDTSKKVSDIAIKVCKLKFYPKDSVVIAMYGATIGKVGLLRIKTATNQACCVLPANKHMIAKYSFYEFLACKPALLVSAIGGGQPNISQDTIRKQKIAVPPIEDQKSIADYLDKKCVSIDSSISKAQHQVELLQEYKQSLITEVVTGKRKVS